MLTPLYIHPSLVLQGWGPLQKWSDSPLNLRTRPMKRHGVEIRMGSITLQYARNGSLSEIHTSIPRKDVRTPSSRLNDEITLADARIVHCCMCQYLAASPNDVH